MGRVFGKETPTKNGSVIMEVHRMNEAAIMPIMSKKIAPIASVTFDSESVPQSSFTRPKVRILTTTCPTHPQMERKTHSNTK